MDEFRPMSVKAGESVIAQEQRVRIQGSKNMTLFPDFALITIYNLSDEDLTSITFGKTISVFGKDEGLIFTGEIDDIYTKQSDVDMLTIISAVDGKTFWRQKIAKSLGGGSSVKTTLNSIITGANMGAFTADDVRIIRGQSYSGRLAECVSMLAKSVGGRAYITNNTVFVTAKGKASEVVVLNDEDVLNDQDSSTGARMIKTTVKGYPVGALIDLNGSKYRLISQKIDADNFEGAWESYLILVNEQNISDGGMEGG